MEGEIESHYYNIHTALLNAFFINDSYAILILEGYMMALIKQTEFPKFPKKILEKILGKNFEKKFGEKILKKILEKILKKKFGKRILKKFGKKFGKKN